jgi:hypothetical protein
MAFNIIAAGPPEWLEEYFAAGGVRPGDTSVMVDDSRAEDHVSAKRGREC